MPTLTELQTMLSDGMLVTVRSAQNKGEELLFANIEQALRKIGWEILISDKTERELLVRMPLAFPPQEGEI